MPTQSDDLAGFIARAQRNDPDAYEHIYNHYVDALYRYLFMQCNDTAMAEEVLGELWLRVVQHLPQFRIPERGADQAFSAWLYRIARNLAIDALRSTRRFTGSISEMIPSPEPDLDHYVVTRDDAQSLSDALARLTSDQREVILLRFIEERSSTEVARLTGRTETAVKALQHRALGALARALGIRRQTTGT